jgi:hypothetical protein
MGSRLPEAGAGFGTVLEVYGLAWCLYLLGWSPSNLRREHHTKSYTSGTVPNPVLASAACMVGELR